MNAVPREKPQVQIKVSIDHWSCSLEYFFPPKPTFTDFSLSQTFPKPMVEKPRAKASNISSLHGIGILSFETRTKYRTDLFSQVKKDAVH